MALAGLYGANHFLEFDVACLDNLFLLVKFGSVIRIIFFPIFLVLPTENSFFKRLYLRKEKNLTAAEPATMLMCGKKVSNRKQDRFRDSGMI